MNIYPIVDTGTKKDSRYYTNSAGALSFNSSDSQVERPFTSSAKDIDDLKDLFNVNTSAYNVLKGTDWYVIREMEAGTEAPHRVLQFRRDVRSAADDLETQLDDVTAIGDNDSDDDSLLKFVKDFTFPALDDSSYDSTNDSDYDSDL